MSAPQIIGSRIRERRLDQGMRQADVASAVGISASYLNLIEHNKRRIGGKLLSSLAAVLEVTPETLAEGAEPAVLDGMRSAAARLNIDVEMDRAQDIAIRFPGWAGLIAAQNKQIVKLEQQVQALSDRLEHDPSLATALHDLITSVTAIRATAGILLDADRVDEDWQRRFHANLHADSRRLTEQSKALVSYLDRAPDDGRIDLALTAEDQAEELVAKTPSLLLALNTNPERSASDLLATEGLTTDDPRVERVLHEILAVCAEDARLLPLEQFLPAAIACEADPAKLVADFDAPLSVILRRIAYLPDDIRLPHRGLAVCDASGMFLRLKGVPGIGLSRHGARCPHWPIFKALQQIGRPVRQVSAAQSPNASRFAQYAVASIVGNASFTSSPKVESTMLIVADPPDDIANGIGASDHACDCAYCRVRGS